MTAMAFIHDYRVCRLGVLVQSTNAGPKMGLQVFVEQRKTTDFLKLPEKAATVMTIRN
jgi:hypothetical protein